MHIPDALAWSLTVLFALLAVPSVYRLVRLDATRYDPDIRQMDVAEVLMVVAMVAMVSPLGGPIPAAGWQAILALMAGWFLVAALRGRRCCAVHHMICAAAMLYMITAMPRHGMDHGPWLTMSEMPGSLAWPALAVAAVGYFAFDATRSGFTAARMVRGAPVREAWATRPIYRAAMGVGMAYMLLAGITPA
ncbi:DUF5134 domain-containing protein [Amycolatopsis acidiphila]|uniref:DUF5134 domain-containing protein n=1 Tax=Amycolatopsis acidiphila TaxID=715473 RepID=A0A558AEW3_9PSEU|nr:DUF5134 domain-containing protein [Amycolatopsis acidiphila]TVT22807.1 DUF5134 domain-containing protein [Amycolatopsis acidiphila]UIJ58180.1 DUF5134 domain-containing protein [Amycolatopsis acidiphila]GHG69594.1 DUF5134 domain-containing protein [Amycolatopsis acidiphila]